MLCSARCASISTADDPARVFTLQLLRTDHLGGVPGEAPIGLVAITLDVAGLVRRDKKTLWVHDDGRIPAPAQLPAPSRGNAFDYPGTGTGLQLRIAWCCGA